MTSARSLKRINYSHAVLIAGMLLTLAVVMFRPGGAIADLPTKANVYKSYDAKNSGVVSIGQLEKITATYDVIPAGKTSQSSAVPAELTGVPLTKFLENVGANLDGVNFVKVRLNTDDDSRIAIVPLIDGPRPPMILSTGTIDKRKIGAPAVVFGQPNAETPISEDNIRAGKFSKSGTPIQIIPGQPGAKPLNVTMSSTHKSGGQFRLTAHIQNGSGAAPEYQWFQTDSNGDQVDMNVNDKSVTTSGTSGKNIVVTVVVTESATGSTGTRSFSFSPPSKNKGRTTAPTGSTGGSGTGSGTGTGTGTGTGQQTGSGITPAPNTFQNNGTQQYTPPQTTTPTPQPTAQTSTPAQTSNNVDTTAITNAAQNVSGSGGLKTVSGVLLSSPTVAPSGSSGSATPLNALPAPVATELNSIFKPVDSANDVWAYLIAVLFAFSISGAVREWVNP